jgi:methionyl-tRNA formyltransferase
MRQRSTRAKPASTGRGLPTKSTTAFAALSPFPGAWAEILGERVKLLASALADGSKAEPGEVLDDQLTIACGDGAVRLTNVQRAGGKPMPAADFLRGSPISKGTILP